MEKYEIDKLRDLPIIGVAERLNLKVSRRKCLCVHHNERRPSMTFNTSKNTYRCWSCGAHGGTIDLAMQVLNVSFLDACRWLADEHNVILTECRASSLQAERKTESTFDVGRYERYFEYPWLSPTARDFLFHIRRLHPAVVKFCRLNSYGDWLQIPYYSEQRKLIGIQRRYMGSDPSQPRFRFMQGERCHLYNQQVIPMLRDDEPLYIGEGPSDVWALLSSGKKAVGIPSATLLKPDDLLSLSGRQCHIYPDADAAGNSLYERLLAASRDIGFILIRHDLPEGCKDFADFWIESLREV